MADYTRVLMRVIKERGRKVVSDLAIGVYDTIANKGGGTLISTSIGGKSFSFQIDRELSPMEVARQAEEAVSLWDSLDSTQRDDYFTRRKQKNTVVAW